MSNGEMFCCGEQVSCVNYRADYLVCFKYLRQQAGCHVVNDSHCHFYWIFVLDGTISVNANLEKKMSVEGGEMVLLSSSDHFEVVCDTAVELIFFTSDHPKEYSTTLAGQLRPMCENIDYCLNKLPVCRSLDAFLKLLVKYLADGMACGHLLEEKQEELFILLNNYYTKNEVVAFLYPYVMQKDMDFKKIVLLNSLKAKSVNELADLCGFSMITGFKKVFKEVFDEPIYQWMLQQKAEKLRHKLAEDDVNLKGLIDEFGFSSPAHFTKFCKKWLGKTPTQFMDDVKSSREQINL